VTAIQKIELNQIDGVELISLVDNTVDFLSGVSHKQVQQFGQWAKQRHGKTWLTMHTE
jgi:hypothetical protein